MRRRQPSALHPAWSKRMFSGYGLQEGSYLTIKNTTTNVIGHFGSLVNGTSNSRFEELRPPVASPWQKDRGRKRKKGSLFYFSAHIFLPGAVCKQPTWLKPRIAVMERG